MIFGLILLNLFPEGGEGNMNIGDKLRRLRLQRNLTQEEMADRCELSKGFISQVERDLASPSIATLTDMLECLGSNLKEFFSETDTEEKTVFTRADMFVKEDAESLRGSITWLVPSAQKNEMEPILVELDEGGRTQEMPPHEGEEFGYVLQGTVTLRLDGGSHKVKTGESFCLHPGASHWIENNGKRRAQFIWVSTPPNF
jgi:transcriptional regulator with XRE-family HTH domain